MVKDITETISHPNIMKIEKVFQVGSKFYLVFPLCMGGELYEHIIRRGHFTEYDAAVIMHDLMSALHTLHGQGILHLDIKPENILFDTAEDDAKIKLTDFGLSRMLQTEEGPGRKCNSGRSIGVANTNATTITTTTTPTPTHCFYFPFFLFSFFFFFLIFIFLLISPLFHFIHFSL